MATIFHNIPRDAETVALVRRGCDARGFPASCRERPCRRTGRCRGSWRAEEVDAIVLPPCLGAACDRIYAGMADLEVELMALRLIVARARKLADAEHIAEGGAFEPPGLADPSAGPWDG